MLDHHYVHELELRNSQAEPRCGQWQMNLLLMAFHPPSIAIACLPVFNGAHRLHACTAMDIMAQCKVGIGHRLEVAVHRGVLKQPGWMSLPCFDHIVHLGSYS